MVVRVRYRYRTRVEDDWAIGAAESNAVTFEIPEPAPPPREEDGR
jgi:hypothetical protein